MHNEHGESSDAVNPWADHINEAYYDGMGAAFGARTRDRINWMCSQVTGETVLDVGCSQGITAILLAREGLRVTGIDIDQPTIDYAISERAKEIPSVQERIEFHCMDLAGLAPALFDTVLMGEVIEHQTSPSRFIGRAAAFLAPGGRLIVTVPFGLNPWPDHKSTIYPGDLVLGLPKDFTVRELIASDGYIRLVADRDMASSVPDWDLLLDATRVGALDVHRKYYVLAEDLKQLHKQKGDLQSSVKITQSKIEELLSEKARSELSSQRDQLKFDNTVEELNRVARELERVAVERDSALAELAQASEELADVTIKRRIAEVELDGSKAETDLVARNLDAARSEVRFAGIELERSRAAGEDIGLKLTQATAELDHLRRELNSVTEREGRQAAELEQLRRELNSVTERGGRQAAELEQLRRELNSVTERGKRHTAELDDQKTSLEARLVSLRSELAVSQQKRTGHFLHLEAERAYGELLKERMRELHEENFRFNHSLALAIGQAILQLRTPRGILAFPGAMARAFTAYRRRGDSIPKMSLPARVAVSVPPVSGRSASPIAPGRTVNVGGEVARKQLSVDGWTQKLDSNKPAVMSVMDEFSRACFAPHANLIEPRPDNWEGLLDKYNPDFLFIESSWKGNSGSWQYRVGNYANPPGNEILDMVGEFRKRGIPTVFWNKEDPVHFNDFVAKAIHFDHIFTTAQEAIPRYVDRTTASVDVLQFAAEETLHNPIGSGERNSRICFAGSFYANRFPERRDDQLMLLDAALAHDFDIFDRNHKPGALHSDFSFPERFSGNIRGSLPYSGVNDAYRKYRVFLNVNSVIDSPTMFSRRVFELLACGTPVVSTWSQGTEETFGSDLVWHVRSAEEAKEALAVLMTDDREWTRRSLQGIREVFAKHTYRHRFQQIRRSIGLGKFGEDKFGEILVVAEVASSIGASQVLDAFSRQVLVGDASKRLMLICRTDLELGHAAAETGANIQMVRSERAIEDIIGDLEVNSAGTVLAVMATNAVYGKFYLQDLVNALRYSGAAIVGKPSVGDQCYQFDVELDSASLMLNMASLSSRDRKRAFEPRRPVDAAGKTRFAADSANFKRVGDIVDAATYAETVQKIEI
ncbi:glycosyltransferase [Stenotrophomonas sp.]|uniref:glycosyltransferase family protein n=1 Tax=Stenotrophomonas sp. TaxID=69392 RepID=UPI0028B11ED9|nr:glycosyltransferase [Stenotrophomonas sp.]